MDAKERKRTQQAAMKSFILEAASDLHTDKGLESTTIRKISERIGYSPATIYLYYPSRDAILDPMRKVAFKSLLTTFQSAGSDQNPVKRLRNLGRIYIDFGVKNPGQYDLMFLRNSPMEAIGSIQPADDFYETFHVMQRAINECVNKKQIIYKDAHTVSLQFWFLLHGLVSLYVKKRLTDIFHSEQHALTNMHLAWEHCIASVSSPNCTPAKDT